MRPWDVLGTAIGEILANKLRSFFTLLGIIVSVAFLSACADKTPPPPPPAPEVVKPNS